MLEKFRINLLKVMVNFMYNSGWSHCPYIRSNNILEFSVKIFQIRLTFKSTDSVTMLHPTAGGLNRAKNKKDAV